MFKNFTELAHALGQGQMLPVEALGLVAHGGQGIGGQGCQLLGGVGVFTDHRVLRGLGRLRLCRLFGGVRELGRREQYCQGEEGGSQKHSAEYTQARPVCKQEMSVSPVPMGTFFTPRTNQTLSFWRNATWCSARPAGVVTLNDSARAWAARNSWAIAQASPRAWWR